jgi:NAD(P)-dependent dehydrogenase (short-subunit alcohol dehydrogenase family)
VTREDDIVAAIALAQERFGPLTGMVNNAGVVGAIVSLDSTAGVVGLAKSAACELARLGIRVNAVGRADPRKLSPLPGSSHLRNAQ